MKVKLIVLLLCSVGFTNGRGDTDYRQPEQLHLSLGEDANSMRATWVTQGEAKQTPKCQFGTEQDGITNFNQTASGDTSRFEDSGKEKRSIYIHRVLMTDLVPEKFYYYRCGTDDGGWSPIFWFTAISSNESFDPHFLIYGDLGNMNSVSLTRLQTEIHSSRVDAILHVGDLAYDMADDDARKGDEFMRQIEPIAAYMPYQVCPGNHEFHYNFSNYNARFSMYNTQQKKLNNLFHSFNIGPVHVVFITTEIYFYLNFGYEQIQTQYNWLLEDLTTANLPENRAQRPWIFLMGHRPMYCTNTADRDCKNLNGVLRSGLPFTRDFALEPLLKKFGVDLYFSGHQHSYERLWPIFNATVSDRTENAYINPEAPVHIVTGSPGNQEKLSPFGDDLQKISAFRTAHEYTFTRLHVENKHNIYMEQVGALSGSVIDTLKIQKDSIYPAFQKEDMPLTESVYHKCKPGRNSCRFTP